MKSRAPASRRAYSQTTRAQSAEETGRRILEAFVKRLMTVWFDEITLDLIAQDADVTVQTIVRRFGGKEGLLGDAVELLADGIRAQRAMPSGNVDTLVANLFADYQKTGDTVIRLLASEARHPALKQFLDIGRREHRQWVSQVLAGQLEKLAASDRQRAVDALVIVTDVYAWKLLCRDMGRGIAAAIATTKLQINAILAEIAKL